MSMEILKIFVVVRNVNSKLKKGQNSFKRLDRVISPSVQVGGMMVNNCASFKAIQYVNGH
jgi:hypothetical protein